MVKNPHAHAEDLRAAGSIAGWGRSPGGRNATHSIFCPGSMDGGAWPATVHGVCYKVSDRTEAI